MSQFTRNSSMRSRARQRGVSLIELMVALTISMVLIAGAIGVYVYSRQNYDVNESVVRLQETARYALSIMEPDIRMANSYGLMKGGGLVETLGVTTENTCGDNFALNLAASVDGSNNGYALECGAANSGAVASADTLIVRRAAVTPASAATTGRLRVCSTRSQGLVVADTTGCTPDPFGQINDLIVNAYYIDRDSLNRPGVPALYRYEMTGTETMDDVEIVSGIEDLQVQFGIDPTGVSGTATQYVNPGDAALAGAQVVSVRLWLLIRSDTMEQDFENRRTYDYADRDSDTCTTADLNDAGAAGCGYLPTDRFRRLLVSKTIQIRNALGT